MANHYSRGAKTLASGNGLVLGSMALSTTTVMLAKGHGATVNLERTLVAAFMVTVVLVALSSVNPGLAAVLALLVLSQVLLTYGTTALAGIGAGTGSTAAVPQIASSGDLAAGAAAAVGTYTAYKLGESAVSGLAQAGGAAAGAAAPSLWSKFKNALTGGTEDAAELAAEGLA